MKPKELDQFMRDYHSPQDTIKVSCQWLQEQLRVSNNCSASLRIENKRLMEQLEKSQRTIQYLKDELPTYSLNLHC